ncbi:hypothetical protein DFH06DRAFT_429441 [Mycena polygramma]|nr:hypothetical protein DFH06DRAFT_429441 [Mycena polygramma]
MPHYDPGKRMGQLMECTHLPCEHVRALLMEERNIQPVATPRAVTMQRHPRAVLGPAGAVKERRARAGDELYLYGTSPRRGRKLTMLSGRGFRATSWIAGIAAWRRCRC